MPILVIFAVAGLIYLLQDRIYKRFWNVNLHADVEFEDQFIYEGEDTHLRETLSNGKILPLPWVYVKFQINRNGKDPASYSISSRDQRDLYHTGNRSHQQ